MYKNIKKDGTKRSNVKVGDPVKIVLKKDQKTGVLTSGTVKRILTNSQDHHRGIKVMLNQDDQVGRIVEIYDVVWVEDKKEL